MASATLIVEAEGLGYLHHEVPEFAPASGFDAGDLELEPVRALEFRVLDPDGRPIADAFARVDGPSWLNHRALVDMQGRGVLPFAPERAASLRFSAFRYADRVVLVEPGARADVVLERLATLEIQVDASAETRATIGKLLVSADGPILIWNDIDEPAAALQDELGASHPNRQIRSDGHGGIAWSRFEYAPSADGRYLLVGLRPDSPFEIDVQDAGGRSLAVRSASVAAGEWQRLEIALD